MHRAASLLSQRDDEAEVRRRHGEPIRRGLIRVISAGGGHPVRICRATAGAAIARTGGTYLLFAEPLKSPGPGSRTEGVRRRMSDGPLREKIDDETKTLTCVSAVTPVRRPACEAPWC